MYGIPAFANGGVVHLKKGGDPLGLFKPKGLGYEILKEEEEPTTAITGVYEDKIIRDQNNPPPVLTEDSTTDTRPTEPSTGVTVSSSEYEEEDKGGSGKEGEIKMTDERMAFERFKNKSDFYKSILAKYGEDDMRTQGFLQLAQFGLNLMSQAGSNFLDKVAKSAQDPLKAFADIAARDTQAQKEIDVLALKQVEDDIATEKQNEFELRLQAIKESGKSTENDLVEMKKTLKEFFPDKYPDTPEGRKLLAEDALKYVEYSPEDTPRETATAWKQQILADVNNEAWDTRIRDEEGKVDLNKVNELAYELSTAGPPNIANQNAVATGASPINLTGMTLDNE